MAVEEEEEGDWRHSATAPPPPPPPLRLCLHCASVRRVSCHSSRPEGGGVVPVARIYLKSKFRQTRTTFPDPCCCWRDAPPASSGLPLFRNFPSSILPPTLASRPSHWRNFPQPEPLPTSLPASQPVNRQTAICAYDRHRHHHLRFPPFLCHNHRLRANQHVCRRGGLEWKRAAPACPIYMSGRRRLSLCCWTSEGTRAGKGGKETFRERVFLRCLKRESGTEGKRVR